MNWAEDSADPIPGKSVLKPSSVATFGTGGKTYLCCLSIKDSGQQFIRRKDITPPTLGETTAPPVWKDLVDIHGQSVNDHSSTGSALFQLNATTLVTLYRLKTIYCQS